MLAITNPYVQISDFDGKPLNDGRLYFGLEGLNPSIAANQIPIFWDAAGTQPAAQPVRTLNGYFSRNGTPAQIFANSGYSIAIYDKKSRLIAYSPSGQLGGVIDLSSSLAGPSGASLIGYNETTVEGALDNIYEKIDINSIRANPLINEEIAKLYAIRHQLIRGASTGGFNSVIQGVACDPVDEQILSISGGGTDGRGHSLNIFDAGALGDLSSYVWNRSIFFGHQGIGLCRMPDGSKTVWLSRNYNDLPNTGNKVTSFSAIKPVNTDSITDGILEWSVFAATTSSQSTTPNISTDGRYLIAKTHTNTEGTVRVFDVQKMWANRAAVTDYSNDYLYEIKYQRPLVTDGIDTFLQGLACDGQYVYVLEHKPGLAPDSRGWVYTFTLDGVFHSRIEITNVGRDLAIANSPNPIALDGIMEFEGIVIFGSGDQQSLALALCTSWPENGALAKRAYVLELGKQSVAASLKAGVSSTSQTAALTSGSAYGVKYSFGAPGGFNWTVHPTRKGILTNEHDPLSIINALWSGIQVASTGSEGMSNLLLARLTDDAEASRHMFYKSRSADFNGSKAVQSTDRIGRTAYYGDIGGGRNTAQLGAEVVVNVRAVSGATFSTSLSTFLSNSSGVSVETLYTNTEVFRPQQSGTMSLGDGPHLWTTVYAQTGAINVSDENEKQSVLPVSDAEKRVGQRLRGLLRTFKYNSAVDLKGVDGARIHIGWIAQHVKAAFEAEGLDGFRYACLCFDEWPEQPEIRDEDGSILTQYMPAGSRMGVRETQIIAFILSTI